MRQGVNEMLSIKRLIYVMLIVVVVSAVFMIYNVNEERARRIRIQNHPVEVCEFTPSQEVSPSLRPRVWLLGGDGRETYKEIYENCLELFQSLHFVVESRDRLDTVEADSGDLVVFCGESVGKYADLKELDEFISRGGKVILAAGLPEGNEDSYLWPMLAIREKSVRENYHRLRFEKPLLPLQAEEMAYDGYSLSTWLSVGEEAQVYIRDAEKGVPLLYVCPYGQGSVCLINGTFLADGRCAGLLTGAAGLLWEDFIYPVLGVKAVFLDNFPMITYIDDKLCMQMYGCSTEGFVRDVVWPAFQGITLRSRTPYTSSVLAAASSQKSFPAINDSLFTTIGKSALQYDGELVYAANCLQDGAVQYNHSFIDEFNTVFVNYEMRGLALQSDRLLEGMLSIPGADVRAVRGRLGDKTLSFSDNGSYFVFPAATAGNSVEEGNLFAISSVLGAYGMISHVFDVNTLIAKDAETASWDVDKRQLGVFESEILNPTSYLEGKTLSQLGGQVRSYLNLSYGWEKTGGEIRLECGGMMKGQAFFLRTRHDIVGARGLTYEEIGNGYYLLRVQDNHAAIVVEEG